VKSSSPHLLNRLSAMVALALVLIATGCKRDDVKVYQVSKEDSMPTPASASHPMTAPAPAENSQPQLQFVLPAGWQQIAPSQMRVASFIVTNVSGQTVDIGVIPLPAGEDELALVNMWRDQMQLPALTNATAAETVAVGEAPAKLFELASEKPLIENKFRARVLVAELTRGATSWFFKMTGEEAFVAAQKENFLQFLKSVSFAETAPAAPTIAPPASTEGINPAVNSIWTIPAGWQSVPPSASVLFAQYLIQADAAKAEVNILVTAGEGGGLAMNVNRWRGQLGLPPVTEIPTSTFNVMGGQAQVVDFTGTNAKTGQPARLVGAIVPQNGQTWFYKLMGDEKVVAAQHDAFIQFIQSAKYPDAH
jgi:hypothetical protein